MISEKEYELLFQLKKSLFIKRDDFDSDEKFDYACEMARELLTKELIHTNASKPFLKNNTGQGSQYALAGKFSLSATALDAVTMGNYGAYKKAQPKESKWSLGHRLTVLSIIVALLGVVAAIVYA